MTRLDIAKMFVVALNGCDVRQLGILLHDDLALDVPFPAGGIPGFTHGKKRVLARFEAQFKSFQSRRFTLEELYDCPDQDAIVIEVTTRGLLASGHDYQDRHIFLLQIRDGLIGVIRDSFDPDAMNRDIAPLYLNANL